MKKLFFAVCTIAAIVIVSSCSSDNIEDIKKENAINKRIVSPSATMNALLNDTLPQTNDAPVDEENPPKP